jgi:hypothetical protein
MKSFWFIWSTILFIRCTSLSGCNQVTKKLVSIWPTLHVRWHVKIYQIKRDVGGNRVLRFVLFTSVMSKIFDHAFRAPRNITRAPLWRPLVWLSHITPLHDQNYQEKFSPLHRDSAYTHGTPTSLPGFETAVQNYDSNYRSLPPRLASSAAIRVKRMTAPRSLGLRLLAGAQSSESFRCFTCPSIWTITRSGNSCFILCLCFPRICVNNGTGTTPTAIPFPL